MALAIAVCAAASRVARADAPAANAVGEPYETLETVLVTGSNIRRVETETANPIITIDRAAIDRSGKVTLGDLVQDLPVVAGPYTNPRVNVGGGTGASTISLRGLGSQRTLILVDGQRYLYGDANAIPAAAIERIEVLTDGASSVYGSDAIGGVVNFILRDNYQGVEFAANYGISDRDDGARYGYHFVFGQSSDTGHILAGVDYNKFEPVLASNREFSKQAAYYFYGAAHVIVVGQTPGGRIELPPSLQQQFGCKSVTLKALGVISNPPSLDDFRCYTHDDGYDRQGHGNLELTPQERSSAFVVGGYKLTDKVETYLEYFHNKTQSAFQVAPSFLDTAFGTLAISSKSFYNPFGVDYNNNSYFLRSRLIGNGNRVANSSTSADQATAGFKGAIGDSTWQWNAYMNYGHYSQRGHTAGFIDVEELAGGLGPSYRDAAGHVVCGTDPALGGSGPIAGCVPIDIFNVLDPQTVAALDAASGNAFINVAYLERSYVAEANGTAFTLPAGTVSDAVVTENGAAVVKVLERKDPKPEDMAKEKDTLRTEL
ncbi:MAG TPA: TonB-dependent receptor plug domain-containing protein, partial [Rudaea sp.]|nr:TonB-dependent receptor plug domain-containing protein [Rudaea sp.]